MKKIIILCVAVLLIGVAIFTTFKMTSRFESFISENIDALTWEEDSGIVDCYLWYTEIPGDQTGLCYKIYNCKECKVVYVLDATAMGFCVVKK